MERNPAGEAATLVTPLIARRIAACLEACAVGTVAALENGSPTALPGTECQAPHQADSGR
jgi:hypothetical protein